MNQLWRTILDADPYWTIGAWPLLIAGILLLLYALFRDRPGLLGIPRERCTRCRYDMTGTAGTTDDQPEITCPECGRSYTSRKPLRTTRRHWKLAALALLLMLGRYAAIHKDRIRAYGWHELIPTAVVVLWIDPERWYDIDLRGVESDNRFSDQILDRVWDRLDVAWGWERDVWLDRVGPSLALEGPYDIYPVGDFIDFRVRFDHKVMARRMSFSGWIPIVPEIDFTFEDDLHDLMEIVELMIATEDWIGYGGNSNSWFSIGDRVIVQAPQPTLDQINRIFQETQNPIEMPDSPDDALNFGGTWALRFPIKELYTNASTDFPGIQVQEAIKTLVDPDRWEGYIIESHHCMIWQDELWILSTKDIRQQVIDAAHRIAAEGADHILETQSKD